MIGFCCPFDGKIPDNTVGLVVGSKYQDTRKIEETLRTAPKEILWVVGQPKRTRLPDAEKAAQELLEGADVVVNPMNPWFKHSRGDDRRLMIDCEIALYCSKIIVFDDGGERCKWWRKQAEVNPRVKLVT